MAKLKPPRFGAKIGLLNPRGGGSSHKTEVGANALTFAGGYFSRFVQSDGFKCTVTQSFQQLCSFIKNLHAAFASKEISLPNLSDS